MDPSNFKRWNFTDVLEDEIPNSQPFSLPSSNADYEALPAQCSTLNKIRPEKHTGQYGDFRCVEEIDLKYRHVFTYPYFNLVQSKVIEDALYSDKSIVVSAPTGSGKTVIFEMAIVQLLMDMEDKGFNKDFKIIYMAPVKALCTERLTEWYRKFTSLGLLCIEVTGDTDVDFSQLKPYRIIITTPEKWDMLTRRWRDHRSLVEEIKLFLIDEVHILNDEARGPVLEAVVSRMKTIEASAKSVYKIEQLQKQMAGASTEPTHSPPRIRFVAVSATVSNPEDVARWLSSENDDAVFYKFGDECRPVKLKRIVEGFPCPNGASIFKFDIILNYKLWPVIQKYYNGKPTLIFCNTRKSVILTADILTRELTINFTPEQKAKLTALASTIKNKKLQALLLSGVGCHHAGLLFEERMNIEKGFRNRDLPILITTTTLAMGVNLPAHLVIIKNTQQYINGAYQEYSMSTVLQMVGRAGRPQFDSEATAVIMTRTQDKARYQALVGGCEPLQSYLHKRLPENLNSEAALGTVKDVAQCVQWLRSTFLCVRATKDPKRYLGLPQNAPQNLILKKIEELCVIAMNSLASSGLITMDEYSCIESTEAGRLMSIFYLDLKTMKLIMKIDGSETLDQLLWLICDSHELADKHLRMDERRNLNALNRNNNAATIRFPMKGKINTRQMKLFCMIQAILGCLPFPDPYLHQEALKVMRIADRICKCLVTFITRSDLISKQPKYYSAVLNSIILSKCMLAHLWENSPYVSKQLKGIGPTFSTLLASAGKTTFMLLEESHPRDLERIMNKAPPAGNVIRKQISLLPKYQVTATPIDEKSVSIQLQLLNQSFLSENMDNLTAGIYHKCYLVIGDTDNNLLMLSPFKDADMIGVYDGTMTFQVTRKQNCEHKIMVHCVSSSFVGVDVSCEYSFKGLESVEQNIQEITNFTTTRDTPQRKYQTKQTCITDTFKERKRKYNLDSECITQSKEKKKRDTAIIEKLNVLKESFVAATKELKKDLDKTTEISNEILHDFVPQNNDPVKTINNHQNEYEHVDIDIPVDTFQNETNFEDNLDFDCEMGDEEVNKILNEIENEIDKSKTLSTLPARNNAYETTKNVQSSFLNDTGNQKLRQNIKNYVYRTPTAPKKRKFTPKNNFAFLDLLERNIDLSDEEDIRPSSAKKAGFSDAVKSEIQKLLEKNRSTTNVKNKTKPVLQEPKPADRFVEDRIIVHDSLESFNTSQAIQCTNNTQITTQVENILNEIEKMQDLELELTQVNPIQTQTNAEDANDLNQPLLDVIENSQLNNNKNIIIENENLEHTQTVKQQTLIQRDQSQNKNMKLKESFVAATKELKKALDKTTEISNEILHDFVPQNNDPVKTINNHQNEYEHVDIDIPVDTFQNETNFEDNLDIDCEMGDEEVNKILNEIENEIDKSKTLSTLPARNNAYETTKNVQSSFLNDTGNQKLRKNIKNYVYRTPTAPKKCKFTPKNNFAFLDLLERNIDLSDEEDIRPSSAKKAGFSDAVKSEIQKLLEKNRSTTNVKNKTKPVLQEPKSADRFVEDRIIVHDSLESFNTSQAIQCTNNTQITTQVENILNEIEKMQDLELELTQVNPIQTQTNAEDANDLNQPLLDVIENSQLNNNKNIIIENENLEHTQTVKQQTLIQRDQSQNKNMFYELTHDVECLNNKIVESIPKASSETEKHILCVNLVSPEIELDIDFPDVFICNELSKHKSDKNEDIMLKINYSDDIINKTEKEYLYQNKIDRTLPTRSQSPLSPIKNECLKADDKETIVTKDNPDNDCTEVLNVKEANSASSTQEKISNHKKEIAKYNSGSNKSENLYQSSLLSKVCDPVIQQDKTFMSSLLKDISDEDNYKNFHYDENTNVFENIEEKKSIPSEDQIHTDNNTCPELALMNLNIPCELNNKPNTLQNNFNVRDLVFKYLPCLSVNDIPINQSMGIYTKSMSSIGHNITENTNMQLKDNDQNNANQCVSTFMQLKQTEPIVSASIQHEENRPNKVTQCISTSSEVTERELNKSSLFVSTKLQHSDKYQKSKTNSEGTKTMKMAYCVRPSKQFYDAAGQTQVTMIDDNNQRNTKNFSHPSFDQENSDSVKTYHYSTTKIDIQTKKMLDHQVKLIRKLKVDLDVTEVISKTKQSNLDVINENSEFTPADHKIINNDIINNNKCLENFKNTCLDLVNDNHNIRTKKLNNKKCIQLKNERSQKFIPSKALGMPALPLPHGCIQSVVARKENTDDVTEIKSTANNSKSKEEQIDIYKAYDCIQSVIARKEINTDATEIKSTANNSNSYKIIEIIENQDRAGKITETQENELKQLREETESVLTTQNNSIRKEEKKENFALGNSQIAKILQKFIQSRKDDSSGNSIVQEAPKPNMLVETNSQASKPRRPFRLRDIDKIDVSISHLTSSPITDLPKVVDLAAVLDRIKAAHKKDNPVEEKIVNYVTNVERNTHAVEEQSQNITSAIVDSETDSYTDVEDLKCLSHDIYSLSPQQECSNLDNTMLNPKALLQSIRTDEEEESNKDFPEIIPPPEEFRDKGYSQMDEYLNISYGVYARKENTADVTEIKSTANNSKSKEEQIDIYKAYDCIQSVIANKEINTDATEIKSTANNSNSYKIIEIIENQDRACKITETQENELKQLREETESVLTTQNNSIRKEEKKENFALGNSQIAKILQKFIQSRKDDSSGNPIIQEAPKPNVLVETNSQASKPRRPFRLRDIDKIDVSISHLISSPLTDSPKVVDLAAVLEKIKAAHKKDNPVEEKIVNYVTNVERNTHPVEEQSQNITSAIVDSETDSYTDVEDLECLSHDIYGLSPQQECSNLDNTMLNPKALLQSIRTDEEEESNKDFPEIIPPPEEFRDKDYSQMDEYLNISYGVKHNTLFDLQDSIDESFNRSVFGDDLNDFGPTPSKGIETWTLSEEESKSPVSSSSQPTSHIVTEIRKKTNILCNNLQGFNRSRKTRLGQFKYTSKLKLKK